ncbi:C2H2-type zinc finger protein [Streptomyces sp. NPDC096538]|uniref:C2H2-type zinc finger protein n=1 Tax=Streptomyces sp. NPDC096538 TaxID=3155427 RepID=UPI003330D433
MNNFIRVEPTRDNRVPFAGWACDQVPKVRTVSPQAFAVPHHLFPDIPEELLIGSIVDGHRYVSPLEDERQAELLGVFQEEREGTPGQPLPEIPDEAYPPDAVPLPPPDFAPLDDAPADDEDSDRSDRAAEHTGPYCTECDRSFKSDRALNSHRRQAHPED